MPNLCHKCFYEYDTPGSCPRCGYDATADLGKYPLALRPGSILGGRYIVGRVLGEGGFGITYSAQDYDSKDLVAIKEHFPSSIVTRTDHIYVSLISDSMKDAFVEGKEKFLSEAQTLSQFNGLDNICDIYSYFEENGTAYFAMEYVNGIPLDEFIKKLGRVLSFEEAARLLLPVMDALSHVHEKGIIHRDISPDNIMVSPEGKVMLIDFGAARYSMGEKSRSLDVILKHGFAPREQYARHGRQGAYTDVYAVAATFYYSITGKVPPDAIDRTESDELKSPSSLGIKLPRRAEQALMKALSINYGQRYQSMREFAEALKKELPPSKAELERQKQLRLEEERRKKAELEEKKRLEAEEREKKRLELEEKKRQEAEARRTKQLEKEELKRRKTEEKQSSKARKSKKPLALIAALAAIAIGAGAFFATKGAPETTLPEATNAVVLSPTPSPAPTATPFSWELSDEGTLYIRGEGEMERFTSFSKVPWASDRDKIHSVVIEDGISSISDYSFSDCSALESVSIPLSVSRIGAYSFNGCSSLASIELPDTVEHIGHFAFSGCSALEAIRIPSSLHEIKDLTFRSCKALRNVIMPSTVRSIESTAFWQCENLRRIDYLGTEEQWDEINYSSSTHSDPTPSVYCCSYSGSAGENITWALSNDGTFYLSGNGVMDNYHFAWGLNNSPWSELKLSIRKLDVAKGITSIGSGTFTGCIYLSEVALPDSITVIGTGAFAQCSALRSISLPDSLASMGTAAFHTSGLRNVKIPDAVTKIQSEVFNSCQSLSEVILPDCLNYIGNWAFQSCPITSIEIPESVKHIDGYAFQYSYLRSIKLPASLKQIGSNAFRYCTSLSEIEYAGSQEQWDKILISDGNEPLLNATINCSLASGVAGKNISWVLSNDGTLTLSGNGAMEDYNSEKDTPWTEYSAEIKAVIVEEGVTRIGNRAFAYCNALSNVSFAQSITEIGNHAFAGCSQLKDITLHEGLVSIGNSAFSGCCNDGRYGLTSIDIPDSVTYLGDYAFSNCHALKSVSLPSCLTSISTGAFTGCTNLSSVTLPDSVRVIGNYAFDGCWLSDDNLLPNTVTHIGTNALHGNNFSSIDIPASVVSIGEFNFPSVGLEYVDYAGTEEQWSHIQIAKNNNGLDTASIRFNA